MPHITQTLVTRLFKAIYIGLPFNRKVLQGPFEGLKLETSLHGAGPKVFGTYEKPLWNCCHQIIRSGYQTIINIGAADGYYAAGLALKMPEAQVLAFEMTQSLRERLKKVSQINHLGNRFQIMGECGLKDLKKQLTTARETVIICDIEGTERTVLDPVEIPDLRETAMLVEVHNNVDPGIANLLRSRFNETHTIEEIHPKPPTHEDIPQFSALSRFLAKHADPKKLLSEPRESQNFWFWMTPKTT